MRIVVIAIVAAAFAAIVPAQAQQRHIQGTVMQPAPVQVYVGPHRPRQHHGRRYVRQPMVYAPTAIRPQQRQHGFVQRAVPMFIAAGGGYVAGRMHQQHIRHHGVVEQSRTYYPPDTTNPHARLVNPQTGEWVVIGGQDPKGPAPQGKVMVRGKPGDAGCFMLETGKMRCPNRWVDAHLAQPQSLPVQTIPAQIAPVQVEPSDPGETIYPETENGDNK